MAEVETGSASVAEAVEAGMVGAGVAGEGELVDFLTQVVLDPLRLWGSSTGYSFPSVHHG